MAAILFKNNGGIGKIATINPTLRATILTQTRMLQGESVFRNCACAEKKDAKMLDNEGTDTDTEYDSAMSNARKDGKIKDDGDFDGDGDACECYMNSKGYSAGSAKRICNRIRNSKVSNAGSSERDLNSNSKNTGDRLFNAHTIETIRQNVAAAVIDDDRFYDPDDDGDYDTLSVAGNAKPWVRDIIMPDGDGPWTAVITAADGSLWKIGFTINQDGSVVLADGDPTPTEHMYNAKGYKDTMATIRNAGTSEGVKKAWETRRGGSPAKTEPAMYKVDTHYKGGDAVPHYTQWNTYGSGMGPDKNSYDFYYKGGHTNATQGGRQYSISPVSSRFGRHMGYSLTAFPGKSGGHTWIDKDGKENGLPLGGTFRHPQDASRAAQKHAAGSMTNAKYPWDKCIADNEKSGEESAKKICGSIKAKYGNSNPTIARLFNQAGVPAKKDVYQQVEEMLNNGVSVPADLADEIEEQFAADFRITNTGGISSCDSDAKMENVDTKYMKVSNSGTSEGVKKAWETRRGNNPVDTRETFKTLQVSRKPWSWKDIKSTPWDGLTSDQQQALLTKPQLTSAKSEYPLSVELPASTAEAGVNGTVNDLEYLLHHEGKHYYVNTEGFDYPRYIAEIKGIPPEHVASTASASTIPAPAAPSVPVPVASYPKTYKSSILPIGSVNLKTHSNAMFGKVWNGWEPGSGTNVVVDGGTKAMRVIHGHSDYDPGDTLDMHHDQTQRSYGRGTVTSVHPHTPEGLAEIGKKYGTNTAKFYAFK